MCYNKFQHAKIFDNGFRVGVDKIWWRCDAGGRAFCVFLQVINRLCYGV